MNQQYVIVANAGTEQEYIVASGNWVEVTEIKQNYTIEEIEVFGIDIMAVIGDLDGDYVLATEY